MSNTKKFFIGGFLVCAFIFTLFLVFREKPVCDEEKPVGEFPTARQINLIGTGTSTPADYSGTASVATTSAIVRTTETVDQIDLTIYAVRASSSATGIFFAEFYKSDESDCASAGLTTWFPVTLNYASTTAMVVPAGIASTTLRFTPGGDGKSFSLRFPLNGQGHWNSECFRMLYSTASTTIWSYVRLKELR